MWHTIPDNMTHGVGWTFSQNFSSLASIKAWELWCFEDLEKKDWWMNESINDGGVCRTAPATEDLLNKLFPVAWHCLSYISLQWIALHCTALCSTTLHCTLSYNAEQRKAMLCTSVQSPAAVFNPAGSGRFMQLCIRFRVGWTEHTCVSASAKTGSG